MTGYLLDVNLLIALIDPAHVGHEHAHEWFARQGRQAWATCPLTENGALRILGHPRYPNSPGPPAVVMEVLSALRRHPGHNFWPDSVSLLEANRIEAGRLLGSGQVTDSYLLALAVAHNGRLATLDRRLIADAVKGGAEALEVIA